MSDEQNVIAAVGTAAGHSSLGGKELSKALEAAMQQAVVDALAAGISIEDSETLRACQLEARQRVLDEFRARLAPISD